jgi:hypothetical protein
MSQHQNSAVKLEITRSYFGQGNRGDDDLVQGRRGIPLACVEVAVRSILVRAGTAVVPGLGAGNLGHGALRRSAGGRASCLPNENVSPIMYG